MAQTKQRLQDHRRQQSTMRQYQRHRNLRLRQQPRLRHLQRHHRKTHPYAPTRFQPSTQTSKPIEWRSRFLNKGADRWCNQVLDQHHSSYYHYNDINPTNRPHNPDTNAHNNNNNNNNNNPTTTPTTAPTATQPPSGQTSSCKPTEAARLQLHRLENYGEDK